MDEVICIPTFAQINILSLGESISFTQSPVLFCVLSIYHSSDRLYAAVKHLDPEGVLRRTRDFQRSKGQYIVPGPDAVWSIDGHMKLQFAGIEIYAAIDAYARHILWIYVGVSAGTQISVYCQYLNTLKSKGTFPALLRADRGSETQLVADAHFKMSQAVRGESHTDFEFKDCFRYGKSTKNQRIEAWWAQLTKTQNYRWRVSEIL